MVRRVIALAVFCSVAASGTCLAREPLTLPEIFAPVPPWGPQPSAITWSPSGNSFLYLQTLQEGAASPLMQYDVSARRSRIVVDPAQYGAPAATPQAISWSPDGKSIAF